jgi:hypothetical protein
MQESQSQDDSFVSADEADYDAVKGKTSREKLHGKSSLPPSAIREVGPSAPPASKGSKLVQRSALQPVNVKEGATQRVSFAKGRDREAQFFRVQALIAGTRMRARNDTPDRASILKYAGQQTNRRDFLDRREEGASRGSQAHVG